MNLNIELSEDIKIKIANLVEERLMPEVNRLFESDEELHEIIRQTIKSQVKSHIIRELQSHEFRTAIMQKVNPVIYRTLDVSDPAKKSTDIPEFLKNDNT